MMITVIFDIAVDSHRMTWNIVVRMRRWREVSDFKSETLLETENKQFRKSSKRSWG